MLVIRSDEKNAEVYSVVPQFRTFRTNQLWVEPEYIMSLVEPQICKGSIVNGIDYRLNGWSSSSRYQRLENLCQFGSRFLSIASKILLFLY